MVVCYSVVLYCMVGYGMVWVLTINGCSLQMGAKHPSWESILGGHMPIVYKSQYIDFNFVTSNVPVFIPTLFLVD